MAKKPWWASLKGTNQAIDKVQNMSLSSSLRASWVNSNHTRLSSNSELFAAVTRTGMDYSTARRLDSAYQAYTAYDRQGRINGAGLSNNYLAPEDKAASDAQTGALASAGTEFAKGGNIFSKFGRGFWDLGKSAFDRTADVLHMGMSPLLSPVAAGRAKEDTEFGQFLRGNPQDTPLGRKQAGKEDDRSFLEGMGALAKQLPRMGLGPAHLAQSAMDFGRGVGAIATGDVSPGQRRDMRSAGYDPESWQSRYAWYLDRHKTPGHAVSDRMIKDLKQEFSSSKVDYVREIVTSGVLEDTGRTEGLSPQAQTTLMAIQADEDEESTMLLRKLGGSAFMTMGGDFAASYGLEPGTTQFDVVSALGELAVEWYAGPEIAAGKALRELKWARYGVNMEPEAIKGAMIGDGRIAQHLDGALEEIDTIYHLDRAGDAAGVAAGRERFNRLYPGWAPHYDILYGMREGSVTGSVFGPSRATRTARITDLDDLNPIAIDRASSPKDYSPVFRIRDEPGQEVSALGRAEARAHVADRIGDAVFAYQVGRGVPPVHGKFLMPGQVRLSSRARQAMQPVLDVVTGGGKGGLIRQLDDLRGASRVNFDDPLQMGTDGAADVLTSGRAGEWVRENYTRGGLRASIARRSSRFRVFQDAAVINVTDSASTKKYQDFVGFFVPRAHANFLGHTWAKADPGKRKLLWETTLDMIGNARQLRNTPQAQDWWRQLTKGYESTYRAGETPLEAYSTRSTDMLKVGDDLHVAAAMHSEQFSPGFRLPLLQEVLRNTERVGLFGALLRSGSSRYMEQFARVIKAGQIATWSNMQRQVIEARALQLIEDTGGAVKATAARLGLAGRIAGERAARGQLLRDTKTVLRKQRDELDQLIQKGDTDGYLNLVARTLEQDTGSRRVGEIARMLDSGIDLKMLEQERSAFRLAFTYPVDLIRRAREQVYSPLRARAGVAEEDWWGNTIDTAMASRQFNATLSELGGATRAYAHGSGMTDDLTQVGDLVNRGYSIKPVRIKNTFGYLGTAGDRGAQRWADSLDTRLRSPASRKVAQAIALNHLIPTARRGKEVPQAARLDRIQRRIETGAQAPRNLEDLAYHILRDDPSAEVNRLHGMRAKYVEGKPVESASESDDALRVWANEMVDDLVMYMGGRRLTDGTIEFADEHRDLLVAVGRGADHSNLSTLSRIPEEMRPETVHSRIFVPKKILDGTEGVPEALGDLASKAYKAVVAEPLQRLALQPQMISAHHETMEQMRPMAEALKARGLGEETIYSMLDGAAWRGAVNRTFRYTDNPRERSYFSALAENFLWYERAMEDFVRRFSRIVSADPAAIGRAAVLLEAGEHAGILHRTYQRDEDGETRQELMFTYPGSGLMVQSIVKAGAALGIAESDLVATPYWTDFSAPVRYLQPSLANPIGFTTSPLIGMPLRGVRNIYPESSLLVDSTLATLEGGERSFAGAGIGESLMPVPMKRLWNVYMKGDDGQVASATNHALIHMDAAGQLPGPEATPEEMQEALDALRQQVQNVLTFRLVFATMSPAAPRSGDNVSDLFEVNEADAQRGIAGIRSEWFALLEDMTQKHGPDYAFSEASIEWMRRKEGSIVNPGAFLTGSSRAPGEEQRVGGFQSSEEMTQWMLSNQGFLTDHGDVGYKLLPALGEEYYDQIGYQTQLRSGLRKRRTPEEMYKQLVYNQTQQTWYQKRTQRDEALERATTKNQESKIWDEWNAFDTAMETANPIWATMRAQRYLPDEVHSHIAPNVLKIADAGEDALPTEIQPLHDEINTMARLYREYREKSTAVTQTNWDADAARSSLNRQYREAGDALFEGSRLEDLWYSMRVWED